MTIEAARSFQLALLADDDLCAQLLHAESPDTALELARAWAGQFTCDEFEEAHRVLLADGTVEAFEDRERQLNVIQLLWQLLCCQRRAG